ncbi:CPBP family glutamic-type intramembrane protease [Salinithrix halophila]|uniref:Type II CAAX prenyl endopeptidase Rce1 family protein n=1 Tax=Salinithrix halophila TaxID=1485204 RepID=A0ABV8JFI2_9BACL
MAEVFWTAIQFIPFILILWLVNQAESRRLSQEGHGGKGWTITVYGLLSLGFFLLFLAGLLFILGGILVKTMPGTPISEMEAGLAADKVLLLGLSLLIPAVFGPLLLIPAIRRGVSRFLPIDPDSRVHAVSLALSMVVWAYVLFLLSLGLENLAKLTESQRTTNPMPSLWAQQITFFLIALIGVGWLSRRSLKAALHRLGLVKPTTRQVWIGILAGFGLVAMATLLQYLLGLVGVTTDPNVEKMTEGLMGPLYGSVWGILTLGLSAALGEEAIFRGALQPRLGLFLTTLLFAVVHSNYGLSLSTTIVFMVGLTLGWLRMKHNTSTTMIVHATYNMTLGILAAWAS